MSTIASITYNEAIVAIKQFFESHSQINTVKVGNDFDLNALTNLDYIAVLITPLSVNKQSRIINYNFRITIADLSNGTIESSLDAQTNTILIANDFYSFLLNSTEFEDVIETSQTQYNLFYDQYDTLTAGVVYNISLQFENIENTCAVPFGFNPTSNVDISGLYYSKNVTNTTSVTILASEHNLSVVNNVACYDSNNDLVIADVNIDSNYTVTVTFNIAFTGKIVLSI